MIELPDKKKCFSLPEQVAQNLRNITFLAEQYKNIDALPAIWQVYKEEFDSEMETFEGWTTTFEGWDTTLATYLSNMSSAAVSAIAGQTIAPAVVNATSSIDAPAITGDSIIETMTGYDFTPVNENLQEIAYAGVCKNGNKITFVMASKITPDATFISNGGGNIAGFGVPHAIFEKLYPFYGSGITISYKSLLMVVSQSETVTAMTRTQKSTYTDTVQVVLLSAGLTAGKEYYFRYEETFLLSENLAE